MPRRNPYIENSERWKTLASIDYFTQFVKAWIPFNAWYRNVFPDFERDRDTIEQIKTVSNSFKDKLLRLLDGSDNECIQMKNYISDLHYQLERKYIFVKDNVRISFTEIVIEANPNFEETLQRSGITYKCTRDRSNHKNINIRVLNRQNQEVFCFIQNNGYNLQEVLDNTQYQYLSSTMQGNLKVCYIAINPYKPENLLAFVAGNELVIGQYNFLNDKNKLAKGVIEILYLLRNALFHGKIVPDRDTQRIYEPAYHILRMLVEALG